MGSEKVMIARDAETRRRHTQHVLHDLKAFRIMLERGMFEDDIQRIGAEQELCFIDQSWRPSPIYDKVLAAIDDPHFTTEFLRFNMEINLDPVVFQGHCLSQYELQLQRYLDQAEAAARQFGAHVILTGILPTIRYSDLVRENLTPLPRYYALVDLLHDLRGGKFEYRIDGVDSLFAPEGEALFEGSNTSFQVHLQLAPDDFASHYNWSLAVTAPLLAAAVNSPIFLGKRLWQETRIALFQQSMDTRNASELLRERCPRVSFGSDWIRHSILDLYKDQIARHKAILVSTREEDAMVALANGKVPHLYGLNVHNGTVYNWNRPCFGISDNGKPHLRIEMRALPAGPSPTDEIANAAFWLGMVKGLPDHYRDLHHRFDFDHARENFYRAAQKGLDANFRWMDIDKRISATELILKELLPIAEDGLARAGIAQTDSDYYLDIIRERVSMNRTGAQWQLFSMEKLQKQATKDEAMVAMAAGLWHRQQENAPVHTWDLADITDAGHWLNRYRFIDSVMSTDLFTVNEHDSIDFVANVMDWRDIRHLPVENESGELVGLITCKLLMRYLSQSENHPIEGMASDVMAKNLITVPAETSTMDAISLMQKNEVGCLPVLRNGKLIGIVTEYDIVNVTAQVLTEIEVALHPKPAKTEEPETIPDAE